MASFFRGLILFLFGAIVGAAGILFFTPSFNVVVSRGVPATKSVELLAAPAPVAVPVVAKSAEPVAAPVTSKTAMVVTAAPAPAPDAAAEPALDFRSIAEHLILWPNTVTVRTATSVPVIVDGRKIQDLALEAGTVLQVSKVLADGSIEARAKGAKFEIKSTLTDFSAELGKRVSELVAKGTKIDLPNPATSLAAPAPAAAPAVAVPVAGAVAPKVPLTLAQRVDILFGNKTDSPAANAPASPAAASPGAADSVAKVAPSAPAAAPAAEASPAAAAEAQAAEKGKELERKMNKLFK